MRYHILRFDIWLCLLCGVLLAWGVEKVATEVLTKKYEGYKQEHKVDEGEIGGIAGEDIFQAQNIEDLFQHDTFTVISPGIEYRNKGAGYYGGMYLYALTLPSGERVAARINSDSVISSSDSIFSGDSTLPVGRIVKEDLTKDKYFLEQIEYKEPLDRKDFYIDMVGEAEIVAPDSYIDGPVLLMQLVTVVVTFVLCHFIGSKIGIFPAFYTRKKEVLAEWE